MRAFPFMIAGILILSGCMKDKLYKTSHPGKGAVVVTVTWSNILPENISGGYAFLLKKVVLWHILRNTTY